MRIIYCTIHLPGKSANRATEENHYLKKAFFWKNGLSYWAKFVAQQRFQNQKGSINLQVSPHGNDRRKNDARYSTRIE